jgi:CBS domain-containing protein
MTPSPATIASDATIADAKTTMREQGVRHLPVVEAGAVVGMLSEREVDLIAAIMDRNMDVLGVKLAMMHNMLVVPPEQTLAEVAQTMATTKCGSAVVMDGDTVMAIFTTVDALAVLAELATTG